LQEGQIIGDEAAHTPAFGRIIPYRHTRGKEYLEWECHPRTHNSRYQTNFFAFSKIDNVTALLADQHRRRESLLEFTSGQSPGPATDHSRNGPPVRAAPRPNGCTLKSIFETEKSAASETQQQN